MNEFLDYILKGIITIFVIAIFLNILSCIKKGKINGYMFFLPVFIVFFVLPIFSDDIFNLGFNPYYTYILEATENRKVVFIYNSYILLLLLSFYFHFLYLLNNSRSHFYIKGLKLRLSLISVYEEFKLIIWVIILFPFIFLGLFKGIDKYYLIYIDRYKLDYLAPEYHMFLTKVVLVGVLLCAFVITVVYSRRIYIRINYFLLITLGLIILGLFWLHGKRSIVVIYFFVQIILLLISNVFTLKKFLVAILLSSVLIITFIGFYGKGISDNRENTYYFFRTDFSRDYGVKFAIYNDILIDRHIIPNRFDTFRFSILFFIPRSVWPEKPQPYAVYFTNSAFGNFGQDRMYGWGLTTSIFAEFISNLGVGGLFFAPLIVMMIFNKEAKSSNPFLKILSIIVGVLLLIIQPISFMVVILIYILTILIGVYRKHTRNITSKLYLKYHKS